MSNTKVKPTRLIPTEKLSKRKRRELAGSRRGTWGGISPVTRVPPDSKVYCRSKKKRADRDAWEM